MTDFDDACDDKIRKTTYTDTAHDKRRLGALHQAVSANRLCVF